MMLDVTCPHCEEEFQDENEGLEESEQYEAECPVCGKVFGYSISISIDTYSCELPCGGRAGEGPHDWKPKIGFPEEYFKNKYYCAHCGLERELTEIKEKTVCGDCYDKLALIGEDS